MITYLFWIFLKFLLFGGAIFFISMSALGLIVYLIGIPVAMISKKIEAIYLMLLYIIYIYAYGVFGAYYCKLVYHFSIDHNLHKSWIWVILSLLCLYIWYIACMKELSRKRLEISSNSNITEKICIRNVTNVYDNGLFQNLIIICELRLEFVSIVSFIIFLIFPSLIEVLYGSLPYTFAKLFY
jgi:hypothetical protein